MFDDVVEGIAGVGLHEGRRVVVEKPFGRDRASATELDDVLHKAFPEDRVFRIDHFLGKEEVENLLVFRFANTLLEPRSEEHTSELQSLMRISYAVFCLKKKKKHKQLPQQPSTPTTT